MKAEASFEEILRQKMGPTPGMGASATRTRLEWDQDPAHLAFLLGQMHKTSVRPSTAKIYPQKPKPPPPPHVLTETQKQAYEFFQFQGAALAPHFSAQDLKKAFRTLALKLHPDMKGEAGAFIALKIHTEALNGLFRAS